MKIERYTASQKDEWDQFILESKTDSFLIMRDFMDYHSDRFSDCSFMIYLKNKLEAVLPGNIDDSTFYSHQGLTYGGLVCSKNVHGKEVLNIFSEINSICTNDGVREVIYKPAPFIYHKYPAQEDLYALFRLEAKKIACNISSVIRMDARLPLSKLRKRGIKKADKAGITIKECDDFPDFWGLLEENLTSHHQAKPVHNLSEITMLKKHFPNQIKLFTADDNSHILGGCVLFVMENIVHVQYIAANSRGKTLGALDVLFEYLIDLFANVTWFDFGTSNEKMGHFLNESLLSQKEGFGGRAVVYETYQYSLQ